MEPTPKHFHNLAFQSLPPIKNQQNQIHQTPLPTSDNAFPLLSIAVLSIIATAFLLVSYYLIVIKCCSNRPQLFNLVRWFSTWRARHDQDPFIAFSPTMWNHGLDESVIREIPTFQFKRGRGGEERSVFGCVVCLNEFQEQDMLRILPSCGHEFHLDCIDIWLQRNANCPLCRTSISGTTRYPIDQIIAPSSSPQNSQIFSNSLMGSDEDFVVIELSGEDEIIVPQRQQERMQPRRHSPMKPVSWKPRKWHHVSIMGDECIDVRENDDQFCVQPIRRSFSMDSADDCQLYLSVQAIIRQNKIPREVSSSEECSNRTRRSLFSFGYDRVSKNAVLPIDFEL